MIGGIDLGGTKIEARVFDADLNEVARNRIPTSTTSYGAMLAGITQQIKWLEDQAALTAIGLGTPGLINPRTGVMLTANLPATGERLGADLSHATGREIAIINDCRAFTLSEAAMGAGKGYRNVVGLVIGTGVAGGQAIEGQIVPDMNGQHGEFGHLPLPARFVAQYGLPLIPCGCGLMACIETYLAGPGLVRLAQQIACVTATTQDILTKHPDVRKAWLDLAATLISIITRTSDPDMIVLGGGLGMIDGLQGELALTLDGHLLANTDPPIITQAQHGDASGALGAAIYASQQLEGMRS
ncbi:MAG: putative NBD/HSP70 family sugar kinase [Yoonia sp.]|jgi:predicted NBD/HSP70 family sugar kinase